MRKIHYIFVIAGLTACTPLQDKKDERFRKALNQVVERETYRDDVDLPSYKVQDFSSGELHTRADTD